MRWRVKKNPAPKFLLPMSAIDSLTCVTDYEMLRASFMTSKISSTTRLGIQRLITEGLLAWFKRQSLTLPRKVQQEIPAGSRSISDDEPDNEALIQLIASMTLQSLVISGETT